MPGENIINLAERRAALNKEAFKNIFKTARDLQMDLQHSDALMIEAEKIMWAANFYSGDQKKLPPIIDTLEKAKADINKALQKIEDLMRQEIENEYCSIVTNKIKVIKNRLESIV